MLAHPVYAIILLCVYFM